MSQARRPPKRFAPLDPQKGNTAGAPPLKGVVFDVDGTLWYVKLLFPRGAVLLFLNLKESEEPCQQYLRNAICRH